MCVCVGGCFLERSETAKETGLTVKHYFDERAGISMWSCDKTEGKDIWAPRGGEFWGHDKKTYGTGGRYGVS